jgi:RNA polymerase sigma-70 factor (ECF subfamily)
MSERGEVLTPPGLPPADFELLVQAHRAELHAHCYRMLGSLCDADDALQDTLLRAWRALPAFEGRSSVRTWLYRIATNVCLDAISRRRKRVLPTDWGPPTDPDDGESAGRLPAAAWIEPYPDEALGVADGSAGPEARYERREALELAFVAALQYLAPRHRSVLVMRDVLGFSAKETAAALDVTVASVNNSLLRARKIVEERLPARSQQATLRVIGDARLRDHVGRLVGAFENGDVDAVLRLLAADATFEMPPYVGWTRGRAAIARSWLMPAGPPSRLRYVPSRANGQLALGAYLLDRDGSFRAIALDVLTFDAEFVSAVTAFRMPAIFRRFNLPDRLATDHPHATQASAPDPLGAR